MRGTSLVKKETYADSGMRANVFTLLCGSPIIVSEIERNVSHGVSEDRTANRIGPQNLSHDLHGMSRQWPNKEPQSDGAIQLGRTGEACADVAVLPLGYFRCLDQLSQVLRFL
jgi:hypothetical protein